MQRKARKKVKPHPTTKAYKKPYSNVPAEYLGIIPCNGENGNNGENGKCGAIENPCYTNRIPAYVKGLALLGLSDMKIAEHLDVSLTKLKEWRKEHAELEAAIKAGRDVADGAVAEAMYKLAIGHTIYQDDIKVIDGEVVVTRLEKQVSPNATACIFWLKNRHSKLWRDTYRKELTGADGTPFVDLGELSLDELRLAAKLGIQNETRQLLEFDENRKDDNTDGK